jgi:hypothetical protein
MDGSRTDPAGGYERAAFFDKGKPPETVGRKAGFGANVTAVTRLAELPEEKKMDSVEEATHSPA